MQDAVEIGIRDFQHLLPRDFLRGLQRADPNRIRLAEFFKSLRFIRVAMDNSFDFGDPAVHNFQARQEKRGRAVFTNRCFDSDLPVVRIREVKFVSSHAAHGSPERIAELERDRVLGELYVCSDWNLRWIVRGESLEIPVHHAREAGVIAWLRDGSPLVRTGNRHTTAQRKRAQNAYRQAQDRSESRSHVHTPLSYFLP